MSKLHLGDCLEVMKSMPDNSIDAVISDPPYGLSFMGAKWDSFGGSTGKESVEERRRKMNEYAGQNAVVPRFASSHSHLPKLSEMQEFQATMTPIFEEALRVAKPGAYLLCFGGTRTFHRMACAIEDAGWEIRDCIMWVYGSGFPKSMDVAKAIDKASGYVGEVIGERTVDVGMQGGHMHAGRKQQQQQQQVRSLSPEAKEWDGWGTCLKPAWEPIIVARKPLDGTVANNVLTWGVGALNIDACRVPTSDKLGGGLKGGGSVAWDRPWMHDEEAQAAFVEGKKANVAKAEQLGRFPANLVHDGSQMVLDLFPQSKGQQGDVTGNEPSNTAGGVCYGEYNGRHTFAKRGDTGSAARFFNAFRDGEDSAERTYSDKGATDFAAKPGMRREPADTPARFFYCAKASKKDRNQGVERLLTWQEQDQELTQLLEQASSLLEKDISESMMRNLADIECSMFSFGSVSEGLSQTECRFITSTVIPLITASRTCSSSHRSNTNGCILDAIRTSEESGISLARLAERLNLLKQGSTSGETDTAINAGIALFSVLFEIRKRAMVGNPHPTIKPTALMEWLVKMVTREGSTVLDPFMGSGTTGVACANLGRRFVGIEREWEYMRIAGPRIADREREFGTYEPA